jgi:hypothetical protein
MYEHIEGDSFVPRRRVTLKPVPSRIGLLRRLVARTLGGRWACRYCGKWFVECHADRASLLHPLGSNGRCCPDGHEGYTDRELGWGAWCRERFDYVKDGEPDEEA